MPLSLSTRSYNCENKGTHQGDPGLAILVPCPVDVLGTEQPEASSADDVFEKVKVGIPNRVVRECGDGSASGPRDDGDDEDGPEEGTCSERGRYKLPSRL